MKNVKLFPVIIAIVLTFSCNRNPEEQKSKAIIEDKPKPLVEEKSEIIKEEKSNSYAFSPKSETKEIAIGKPVPNNRQPITKKDKQRPKSGLNLEKTEAEISENIYDIFKNFEKPFQTFTFLPQKDTVLMGLEGTTLKINANSFVTENANKPITDPIQIKLREYYLISDMLLANLSTKSGNELLETGGMVYLEAYSGNEKLKLKTGNQIEIGFPYKDKKEGMQLFNGNWKGNVLDWIPADTSEFKIFKFVDVAPRFPGGETEMLKFINAQIKYPDKAQKQGIEGLVVLSFIVQKDGNLTDFAVLKSVSPVIDAEALRVVKSMPKWKPGWADKQIVSTRYTLPVRFTIDGSKANINNFSQEHFETNDKDYKEYFETVNKDEIQNEDISSISKYILSTSNLGWINCDRFIEKGPSFDFSINLSNDTQQDVKIVFHKVKSIYSGELHKGKCIFKDIPLKDKITIVALKRSNNKNFLAIKETSNSKLVETDLAYEEVTMERLKEEMKKLNKLK